MVHKNLRDEFNTLAKKKEAVDAAIYKLCGKIKDNVIEKLNEGGFDDIDVPEDMLYTECGDMITSIWAEGDQLYYSAKNGWTDNVIAIEGEAYNEVFNFLLNWLKS